MSGRDPEKGFKRMKEGNIKDSDGEEEIKEQK